jgi:hypothetical protein
MQAVSLMRVPQCIAGVCTIRGSSCTLWRSYCFFPPCGDQYHAYAYVLQNAALEFDFVSGHGWWMCYATCCMLGAYVLGPMYGARRPAEDSNYNPLVSCKTQAQTNMEKWMGCCHVSMWQHLG